MTELNIRLSTIEDVRKFVNAATACDYEVDLASGRYVVDAKSIMGIFSLDLLKPIKLTAHSDDCGAFLNAIAPFVVK